MPKLYEHYLVEDHVLLSETLAEVHESCTQILDMTTKADFEQQPMLEVRLHTALEKLQALHYKKTQRAEIEQAESTRRHMF
jgi:hypothetical protein